MSLYDEYNKNKKSTTKGGLYSEFSKSKTKATEPSFLSKALGFGKEIVLDTKKNVVDKPLTNVVQAAQVASKLPEIIRTGKATFTPMTPFNYKGQPVQPLGTRTADNGFTKENVVKDLKDIGGTGLEMASFLGFGPSAKAGFQATKELVKGSTKAGVQTLKRSVAEGAFGGLTQNVGTQLQDNAATGKAFNPMETVKATAGGAVLAPALNIFSKGIGKIFAGKKASEVAAETIAEAVPTPKLTKEQRMAQYSANMGYEPYQTEIPTIQMGKKPSLNELPTIQTTSKNQPKVADFEDVRYEPIPNRSVYSEMPDTISDIVNNGKKSTKLSAQATRDAVNTPVQADLQTVEKITSTMDTPDISDFERQTNKLQVENVMKNSQDDIVEIAMGSKVPQDGMPPTAYYAVAANIAEEMSKNGDQTLAMKLADSPVRSKSGQAQQALNITSKDNIVTIFNDIKNKMEDKMSFLSKRAKNENINNGIKEIQQQFDKVKGLPGTRDEIINALNKLIC